MQRRSGKKLRTRSPTLTALTVFFLTLISISLASLLFYSLMMNTARTEFKQMAQIVSNATISSEKISYWMFTQNFISKIQIL